MTNPCPNCEGTQILIQKKDNLVKMICGKCGFTGPSGDDSFMALAEWQKVSKGKKHETHDKVGDEAPRPPRSGGEEKKAAPAKAKSGSGHVGAQKRNPIFGKRSKGKKS